MGKRLCLIWNLIKNIKINRVEEQVTSLEQILLGGMISLRCGLAQSHFSAHLRKERKNEREKRRGRKIKKGREGESSHHQASSSTLLISFLSFSSFLPLFWSTSNAINIYTIIWYGLPRWKIHFT